MAPPASGSGAVAAGIISKKRKKIIRAFREHGATSPETARSLVEVGLSEGLLVHVMKLRHVIVDVGGGRYYLDAARERQVQRARRVTAAVLLIAVVVVVVVLKSRGLL